MLFETEVERGITLRSCLAEPLGARTRDSSIQTYVHFAALQPRENQWVCMNRRDDCSSKTCCQNSLKTLVRAFHFFLSYDASLAHLGNQPTSPSFGPFYLESGVLGCPLCLEADVFIGFRARTPTGPSPVESRKQYMVSWIELPYYIP